MQISTFWSKNNLQTKVVSCYEPKKVEACEKGSYFFSKKAKIIGKSFSSKIRINPLSKRSFDKVNKLLIKPVR